MDASADEPRSYAGTDEKLARFLQQLALHGMLNRAAREAGVAYSTVWRHRKMNAAFNQAVVDAINEAIDNAEETIWNLMMDPATADVVRFRAAAFILRQRRPEVYGSKVTVVGQQQIVHYISRVPRPSS